MAPTIVLEHGEVFLVLGSAGSSRIPGVVAGVISNVVDRGLPLGDAVAAPRVLWGRGGDRRVYLEVMPPSTRRDLEALEQRGYREIFTAQVPTPLSRFARYGAVNAVHL
jgi:gamma-glutamyltranspeptidase/glutathione hydrolase